MIIALNDKECFEWSTNEEIDHRKQKYTCPACRNSVLFRRGPHLMPHFAHQKNQACYYSSEAESMKHLTGKVQLYKRIKELVTVVCLEKFFSEILQKSDIYFEYNRKKYAVEFQCSQISLEVLKKRTMGYLSIGITPIWVFHTDLVKQKGFYEVKVSKLVQSGLGLNHQVFLYDGSKKNLLILSQLAPFSKCTYFTNKVNIPLNKITINHFIRQQLLPRKYLSKFREKRHYHLNESIRFEGLRVPFYQNLYVSGFSTFTLPSFVGVPLKNGIGIRTPVIEWQGLLFLELIKTNKISQNEIYLLFKKMLLQNLIDTVPICEDLKVADKALRDYIDLLIEIGFLSGKGYLYQINSEAVQSITEDQVYNCLSRLDGLIK
ncbi:MAG: hypothetical protein K0R71_908 [Bacillales bacterium]|jgi:competence CoiA-like predicted nuclease|nr:hypothetical protein [Bacillales bacterium]